MHIQKSVFLADEVFDLVWAKIRSKYLILETEITDTALFSVQIIGQSQKYHKRLKGNEFVLRIGNGGFVFKKWTFLKTKRNIFVILLGSGFMGRRRNMGKIICAMPLKTWGLPGTSKIVYEEIRNKIEIKDGQDFLRDSFKIICLCPWDNEIDFDPREIDEEFNKFGTEVDMRWFYKKEVVDYLFKRAVRILSE